MNTKLIITLAAIGQNGGQPAGADTMSFLVMMGLIFAIFYFFMIRPQAKRQREHQETINTLKRGEEVMTSGGIYGKITGLTEKFVTLEVAPNVRIKILRSSISDLAKNEPAATGTGNEKKQ